MSLIRNKKAKIIAILTGLIVAVMFLYGTVINESKNEKSKPQGFNAVFLTNEIKKGATIKEEDIEFKTLPSDFPDAYKTSAEVVGRVANKDLPKGSMIIKGALEEASSSSVGTQLQEPENGFRAVPVLIKKDAIPPYVSLDGRYDFYTKESSMEIDNLKILGMLEQGENSNNKILVLEIKNSDIPSFLEYANKTKGFVFVKKNKNDYGKYNYSDISGIKKEPKITQSAPQKIADEGKLPPIGDFQDFSSETKTQQVQNITPKKEVEIIIGNQKTKMEFEE